MNDKMVAFRIEKDFYSHLVRESHKLSLERDENLSVSDIIRESLREKYPITSSQKMEEMDNGKK